MPATDANFPIEIEPQSPLIQFDCRIVLAGISLQLFLVAGLTLNSFGVFIEPIRETFGIASSTALLLPTIFLIGVYGVGPVIGFLLERFDVRLTVASGILATSLGYIAAGFAQTLPLLVLALMLSGLGAGACTFVPGITLASRWFRRDMGLAMGVIIGSSAVGAAVLPSALAYLTTIHGWRAVLVVSGGLILSLALPIALMTLRDGPKGRPAFRRGEKLRVVRGDKRRFFYVTALVSLSQLSVAGAYFSFVPFAMELGYPLDRSGMLVGVMNLFSVLGCLAMGPLADRWGVRRILAGALALNAAFMLLPLWIKAGSWLHLLMGIFVVGWGLVQSGPTQLGPVLLATSVNEDVLARLTGTMLLSIGLFSAVGPMLVGIIHDHAGGYAISLLACGLFSLLAIPLFPATRRSRPDEQ